MATHSINDKKELKKKNWRRTRQKRKKDKAKRRVNQVKKFEEPSLQYPFKERIVDYRALEQALVDVEIHSSCVSDIDSTSDVSSCGESANEEENEDGKAREIRLARKRATRKLYKAQKKHTLVIPSWRPKLLQDILTTLDRLHQGINADALRSTHSETRDFDRSLPSAQTREKLVVAIPSLRRPQ